MVIRIGLIGGPGTLKSGQCAHFVGTLKSRSILVEQIIEWVREAFNKKMIPEDNVWVQFWIYEEQCRREDCIPKEIDYIVTDSPTLLSYVYALFNGNRGNDKWLWIKMYEKFVMDLDRYHFLFFCEREKPYQKDGTRKQTKEEAMELDKQIKNLLEIHGCKYYSLRGSIDERTKEMCNIVGIDKI